VAATVGAYEGDKSMSEADKVAALLRKWRWHLLKR